MATCPICGRVERPVLSRVPDDVLVRERYHFHTGEEPPPDDATTWHEHRQPARAASVASDVTTPALQSLVSALAAGSVVVAPVAAFGLSWWLLPAASASAFAFVWWRLLAEHRQHLWQVDTYERELREPTVAPPRTATRLSVTTKPNQIVERELPVAPDVLLRVARALSSGGVAFSERELAGRGKALDGRADYLALRDALLAFGWLRWKSEDRRQGVEPTAAGRAGLRALADGKAQAIDMAR